MTALGVRVQMLKELRLILMPGKELHCLALQHGTHAP